MQANIRNFLIAFQENTIGHKGFTGTSLWLEPEKQTQYIILTNRVHPRVEQINFDALRRKLHWAEINVSIQFQIDLERGK